MTSISINGKSYVVSPLTLGDLRSLAARNLLAPLATIGPIPTAEQAEATIAVLHASLARKNPEVTADFVADNVTWASMGEALRAVLEVSGALPKAGSGPNAGSP